ncbi:MAG: hypothetical protein LBC75_11930 [Fibromonadaceae bacterium]|jgi:hypothetical protein|nr:hypothetical protein [Fibromonadaceae bacterium]
MEQSIFKKLWDAAVQKEIDKTINDNPHSDSYKVEIREKDNEKFQNTIFHRYEDERLKFKNTAGIGETDKLDRHKIAAIFYVAFVDKTNGYPFEVSYNRTVQKEMIDAEAILTHETAFNITCAILETVILENKRITDIGYKNYIKYHGLLEPELICCDITTTYKAEIIKQLIYAQQKENRISVAQLAVIFSLLESYTLKHYSYAQTHL